MNRKAQAIFAKLMVGVLIFIIAIVIIPPVKEGVDSATNETGLNCTNPEISALDDATCTVVDIGFLFYFISIIIAVGLAYIAGKSSVTGVLTSITLFIVVVILITPLKSLIILARDASHLNCGGAISIGNNMLCIFVDLWLFYFVAICLATAVTLIFMKKVKLE